MPKIDLITGFLGSGKTTFLKKYAAYLISQGKKIGILENDHGAVNVDMMLLQDLEGDQCELEMVSGGCDYDCHRRRFKTKLIAMGMSGYDRVLVEPSGVYDADEFFDVLHEEPLDGWYQIGNVITIVDAGLEEHLSEETEYLLAEQVSGAGIVVLSRVQEEAPGAAAKIAAHLNRLMEKYRCRRRFTAEGPEGDIQSITRGDTRGITSAKETNKTDISAAKNARGCIAVDGTAFAAGAGDKCSDILAVDWDDLTDADMEKIGSCGYLVEDMVKLPVDRENRFGSLYFMNLPIPEERLGEMAQELLGDRRFGKVFRVKGYGKSGCGEWLQVNAAKDHIHIDVTKRGQEILIVIGEDLNEDEIRTYLSQFEAGSCREEEADKDE